MGNIEKESSGSRKNSEYKDPVPTVDLLVRKENLILLEERGRPPFENIHCLPGGHVDYGETVEEAALRELREETSLNARLVNILGVYSDPKRDPRGQRISTVFIADWVSGEPKGSDDAKSANWFEEKEITHPSFPLAFDHSQILRDYFEWKKAADSGIPMTFWSTKRKSNR